MAGFVGGDWLAGFGGNDWLAGLGGAGWLAVVLFCFALLYFV